MSSNRDLLVNYFLSLAFPRLMELPPSDWRESIRNAQNIDFDFGERISLMAGVAFVTYLLQFDVALAETMALPIRYLLQFLGAVPLLLLLIGPVYLRRARRGIDLVISRHIGGLPKLRDYPS